MLFGFVGFRVIKTAIAAIMAILVAEQLGLNSHLGAGTLAILAVDVTRKKSLSSVSSRFFASIVSLLVAWFLFKVFGFSLWVLAAYILLTFPIVAKMNFKQGIVTSAVVVFHLYASGEATLASVWNEVLLLVCGLGSATLVNMAYMPKEDEKLIQDRTDVDNSFSSIFLQISYNLRDTTYVWDGHELMEAAAKIDDGIEVASKALENRIMPTEETKIEEHWLLYFYMRKSQLDSIQSMLLLLAQIYQSLPYCHLVADLFEQLSEDVKNPRYTGKTERLLNELEPQIREMELPKTREEFEVRAAILQVFRELRDYLKIAKKDKKDTLDGEVHE
ncbi:aromatic acid exporter family protein [Paenibacillus sp. ACRRX]|nr:aromatic acid exporter family protein [Paenibacillus sp. ACRRX]MCG7406716.1 aromatic acid exporter family protein [Paenibacillus sp. ACRRX]MDK8179734.1 aromatic acid exporter family protein [Paenibacillus sp. UMB4589-SE434]